MPWHLARLKDHVDLINGWPFDSKGFNDSAGTPVIRIRDLLRGKTETFYEGEVPSEVMVHDGDLVVGMDGDFNSVSWQGGDAALNQRLCMLRPRPSLSQRFLAHLIDLPLQAINDVTYFTTVKHLSSVDLMNERIPLPPLAAQRAIADFLDRETARIDALIEKKQRMVELVEEKFRVARWNAVTRGIGGLESPVVGVPMTRPDGWDRSRLRFLVESVAGGAWGAPEGEDEIDVACFRVADFDRWSSTASNPEPTMRSVPVRQASELALREGDLLLEKSGGGDKSPVGFVARFSGCDGPAICSNFVGRMRPVRTLNSVYVAALFAAIYERGLTVPFIKQTTGIQNLDVGAFLALRWAVPSTSEQRRIAGELATRHAATSSLRSALTRQLDLLVEHRQALVTAAVTGEFVVGGVAA
ncbi:MAG: restriction endonuclease subunit S [Actinomycetia bacterium]|nr:restriction endonuclease subunit S [Actinomycetes bacterium]